jgi:hypothetical protein
MAASVRTQLYRLMTIYTLLAMLVVWQWHFIQGGIESNPYLNIIIIGVFLFGSYHGLVSIVALGNEGTALSALREAYDDAVRADELAELDPLWREKRCFEPAVTFKRPRLLDSVYDLALDEIRRARSMRISVETMQTLLHTVDRKIVTDRALLGYLSGLCIFLGLIGTFIGLMEMVGSVGSIIGGVASADSGSPEAIKQLIRDLEAPLKGMATGFSASLFGLFSSLVLGLTARVGAQATNGLRNELEAWLGAMSRIESEREIVAHGIGRGDDPVARLGGVAVAVMGGMQRAGQIVGRAAEAIRLLADRQSEQGVVLGRLCTDLGVVARQNQDLRETLERTTAVQQSMVEARSDIRLGFEGIVQRVDGVAARLGDAVNENSGRILSIIDAASERQSEGIRHAVASAQRVDEAMRRVEVTQSGALAEQQRSLAVVGTALAELRSNVGEGMGSLSRKADAQMERQQRDNALVVAGLHGLELRVTEQGAQRAAGEAAVQAGLSRLAGVVDDSAMAVQTRLDRQFVESQQFISRVSSLHDLVGTLSTMLERDHARQAGEGAQAAAEQNAALDRLARHQAEIGHVLKLTAETLESQRSGLDDDLREAIGAGFGQLSGALVQSQTALARTLSEGIAASAPQAGLSDLSSTLRAELRELRTSLASGLTHGFDEVNQSMTQTIEGLAKLSLVDNGASAPLSHATFDPDSSDKQPLDIERLRRIALNATRSA